MIPYQKEKIDNAACFFASEHWRITKQHLCQTFLYKYLALFEFRYLRKYGNPPLGLTYKAMERGPVPMEIYGRRDDPDLSQCFAFQKGRGEERIVVLKGKPDLDYFSKREVALMKELVEIFGSSYVTSHIMSDASHQDILAWKRTWSKKPNAIIDFSLEFTENPLDKSEDQLTFPEEVFLIQQGFENCA
jgi:hypothetical protein